MRKYVTKQGDTWDIVAFLEYGDEMRIHTLIETNPAHCTTVIFSAGVELTIPEVEEGERSVQPPWITNG